VVVVMRRPNPVRWVYYQFNGRLPDRYRDWVVHDVTCRTWLLRVFVRGLVMVAPIVAVLFAFLLWLGHSWLLAAGSIALGLLVNLRYSLSYSEESTNGRLVRYGFPPGHATTLRAQRYAAEHAAEAERYRAIYRPTQE
jgi:hypothetical protein